MFDLKLWRYIFLTAILEIVIIIIVTIILIVYYPAFTIYIAIGAIIVIIVYLLISYHIYKPVFGYKALEPQDEIIGKLGKAITDLNPRGQVKIRNEVWSARSSSGFISAGRKIKIVEMEGIQVIVEALEN
ncbi:MAG: NfeD family protein [Promethearchaeota archaeon]